MLEGGQERTRGTGRTYYSLSASRNIHTVSQKSKPRTAFQISKVTATREHIKNEGLSRTSASHPRLGFGIKQVILGAHFR